MNQYPYVNPFYLLEQLKKIEQRLSTIEELLKGKKNYLEKDDNYYII